jgi:uncharacterized repeat protein (TIGR01451 family)
MKISKWLSVAMLVLGLCSSQVQAQNCSPGITVDIIGPALAQPDDVITYDVTVALGDDQCPITDGTVRVYLPGSFVPVTIDTGLVLATGATQVYPDVAPYTVAIADLGTYDNGLPGLGAMEIRAYATVGAVSHTSEGEQNSFAGADWDTVVASPCIHIEKATNGEDADDPTGPLILVGGAVNWTYAVTNCGDVPLTEIVVTDDNGTPGNTADDFNPTPVDVSPADGFNDGDTNLDNALDLSETWTYAAAGTAALAQYANIACVVGSYGEVDVDDCDPSHYLGVIPCIDITKDVDCDVAMVGTTVTYTYTIQNCGSLELDITSITDSVVPQADIDAAAAGCNILAPDDSLPGGADQCSFTVEYTILQGDANPLVNTVIVVAVDTTFQTEVSDDDDASVDIVHPDFTVTKVCLTDPIEEGDLNAQFRITITNTGDVDLVITSDEAELPGPVALVQGQPIVLNVLRPLGDGDVTNTINVSATLPAGICFNAEDFPILKSASDTCSVQALCYGDETAWAYGGTAAKPNWDIIEKSKNWGWTNGPLSVSVGTYEWPLYAGAGQNILSNGEVVGTVTVVYSSDGCVEVTYEVDEGFYLGETHLWIGNNPLPSVTRGKKAPVYTDAPGQFPYGVNYGFDPEDSDTWETEWSSKICGFSGNIYVAAHAVVWMEVECEICDNGIDDDGDGLIDSADPDCQL